MSLADEDAVDRRGRLKAGCRVHDVAGGHSLAFARSCADDDQRLTGVHADAHLEIEPLVGRVQVVDRLTDRESGLHGALGIVLVRDRSTEERDDGVADELLDRAAEALELGSRRA